MSRGYSEKGRTCSADEMCDEGIDYAVRHRVFFIAKDPDEQRGHTRVTHLRNLHQRNC